MAAKVRIRGEVSRVLTFDSGTHLVNVEDGRTFGVFAPEGSELGAAVEAGDVVEGRVLEVAGSLQIRRKGDYVNVNVQPESFRVYRLEALE